MIKEVNYEPITAKIADITANGNVTITFSRNLTIPVFNKTEFPQLRVTIERKSVPALELNIVSLEGNKNLDY